jgi:hypothetical protein
MKADDAKQHLPLLLSKQSLRGRNIQKSLGLELQGIGFILFFPTPNMAAWARRKDCMLVAGLTMLRPPLFNGLLFCNMQKTSTGPSKNQLYLLQLLGRNV